MNFFSQNNGFSALTPDSVKCARKAVSSLSLVLIIWMLFSFTVAPAILLFLEYGTIKGTAIVLEYTGFSGAVTSAEAFLASELWEQIYTLIAYVITMGFLFLATKFAIKRFVYAQNSVVEENLKYSDGFMYARLLPIYTLALALSVPFSALVSIFTGIETIAGEQVVIPHGNVAFFISFVTTAILPPFMEEYVFRKLILGSLLPHGKAFALIASSVFFASVHINAPAVASAFVIGLIIGIVYIKGKSLVPCIFLHIINNAVAFAQTSVMEFYPDIADTVNSIFILCVLFFGLASIILLFGGKKKLWSNVDDLSEDFENGYKKTDILSKEVFVSPAFITFIIMIILHEKLIG